MAMEGDENERPDNMDRLSDLHEDLLQCILSCLPIANAVQTSILSKRFTSCWKGTKVLKIDKKFYKDFIEFTDHRFYDVLGSIVHHIVEPVHEFELYVPPLLALLRGRIAVILPLYLIKLTLTNCQLTCPPINMCIFTNLVSMSLVRVHVDSTLLEALIRKSAKLRSLVLSGVKTVGSNTLLVDAHELRKLEYHSSKSSLSLKYLPRLKTAIISSKVELATAKGDCETSSFLQFFSLLPKVEELNLSYKALNSLLDKKIPENLEKVHEDSVITPEMHSCAMSLIRTSLNLKRLEFCTAGVSFHACPEAEVGLEFNEAKLLATIEASCAASLNAGKFNEALEFIKEIIRAAITIREKRNGNDIQP